jgi:hypothetical protein
VKPPPASMWRGRGAAWHVGLCLRIWGPHRAGSAYKPHTFLEGPASPLSSFPFDCADSRYQQNPRSRSARASPDFGASDFRRQKCISDFGREQLRAKSKNEQRADLDLGPPPPPGGGSSPRFVRAAQRGPSGQGGGAPQRFFGFERARSTTSQLDLFWPANFRPIPQKDSAWDASPAKETENRQGEVGFLRYSPYGP